MSSKVLWLLAVLIVLVSACSAGAAESSAPGTTVTSTSTSISPSTSTSTSAALPTTTVPVPGDCGVISRGTQTLAVGDAQRSALVIPAVDENGALITGAPVLLMFHGFIGNAEKIVERTNLAAFTSAHGVHLVAPQGIGALATWHLLSNEVDDSAFIDVLMDELSSSPCVDPDRIGLAGFSAGSAWTGAYACTNADRLALVLMASGLPGNLCSPDADLDIIIAHGTADPVVPFEGGGQEVDGTVVELDTVSESARNWAAGAGCETEPDVETVPDGVTTLTIWTDCGADSVVMFEVVEGMAHSWTGADADGGTLNAGCLAVVRLVGDTEALSQCHP